VFEVTASEFASLAAPVPGLAAPNADRSHCHTESTGSELEESEEASGIDTPVAGTLNPADPPEEPETLEPWPKPSIDHGHPELGSFGSLGSPVPACAGSGVTSLANTTPPGWGAG
jgi:hypothetical protein